MKPKSAKAKGRAAVQQVRDLLLEYAPDLKPEDIRVVPSGVTGEDLWLSPEASKLYPFAVESKCQESLGIWEALKQAESHVVSRTNEFCVPVLFFKRNRSKLYVALEAEMFIKLIR